ncbi:cytidyltransferase [Megamonas funiformis]|uniref:RraA family protein n=1 Tax=Megamonas funiformis TaxID=437897 RepID=UPI00143123E8|nr:cytidyltransferase [Megamonas funiformis]NJE29248.1 cytidyltransferase [Megamonas funiformis]
MKIVAFLPVKGTSERVENKNMKLMDGKPLFLHTLEKLVKCNFLDEVYLDSESQKVFDIASEIECKHIYRDPELATNKTDGHKLFYNEVKQVDADIYVQILCTSPFIKPETIERGIKILQEKPEYDSVVLMAKEKQYLWKENQPIYDKYHIPNSKDLPDTMVETMGLYIIRKDVALKNKMRFGDKVYFLEAEAIEKIDVNYPDEFKLANYIAAGLREKEREMFTNLSKVLSSCMLSDILDDLNIDGVVSHMTLNLPQKRVLGRAKTLKLRKLKDNEAYEGIYDALTSYDTIVPNDIIVVENECKEFAYFGNLNASLAMRAGAVAAIIDGCTRDNLSTQDLDFPVFSRGYNCRDVRKRATVESMNKTIKLGEIKVHPGDLIFADSDGVIVIPRKYEQIVIERAIETINKEKNVINEIVLGRTAKNIVKEVGAF